LNKTAGYLLKRESISISQMVVIDGCDIYNSKVISASSGAIAHVNIVTCTGTQFVEFFQDVVGEDERGVLDGGVSQLTPSLLDQSTLSTPYLVGLTPNRGIDLDQIEPSLQHHFGKLLSASQYKQTTSSTSPIHPKTTQSHSALHQNKLWLVVGSEAFGLPSQIEDLLHLAATIPVQNDFVDSLNASVAASIAIYFTANRIGNGERSGGADVKM
jgi:tRNA G18 (ribose-2'-O)-methylase SpoU